ncbi:MAG: DNA polymerase III subunit [Bacteroidales bacterium]|nr:DNA polymerase III subunit [Bacteroidales bacterium]
MQFKDIIGQRVLINHLTEIIDSGRIGHAQLFHGANGYGTLPLAIAYAQYLNCSNRQHYESGDLRADSCGECPSCKKYQALAHPDLHLFFPTATNDRVKKEPTSAQFVADFVEYLASCRQYATLEGWMASIGAEDKKGYISVPDANEFIRQTSLKAYEASHKVFIIWMAEMMRADAGGAAQKMLKVLEEPSDNTVIILVAENISYMPLTILSRTQSVHVGPIEGDALLRAMEPQIAASGDEGKARALVADAQGDYLRATANLERSERTQQFAGLFVDWMRQLFKLNIKTLSAWVDQVSAMGREQQRRFLMYAQESIRACYLSNAAGYSIVSELDFGDEKFNKAFPTMITQRNVEAIDKVFSDTIYAIDRNAYHKIAFMSLSFSISSLLRKR